MSKSLHKNLQSKIAMLQGPEWNSSDEEDNVAPKESLKKSIKKKTKGRDEKRGKKKMKRDPIREDNDDDDAAVVYIGHLPKEFEERDLKTFLAQFGKVERCRVSRSLKSGQPRGYGFARFTEPSVAKIVAETLQGYFLGNRRLVCNIMSDVKPGTFFDTEKAIARRKLRKEVEKKNRQRNLASASKIQEITARLIQREKAKRAKFAELGIDYDFPGYEAGAAVEDKMSPHAGDDEEEVAEEEESSVEPVSEGKNEKKKKRKDSIDSISSASKKKRKDSIDSTSSASKKKRKDSIDSTSSAKKKKRKDSIDSSSSAKRERADSVGSEASTPKSKRKDSISSETSTSSKSKRKDSIGSEGSASKRRSRKNSEGSLPEPESPSAEDKTSDVRIAQSEKKKKKDKKKKSKRRESAP